MDIISRKCPYPKAWSMDTDNKGLRTQESRSIMLHDGGGWFIFVFFFGLPFFIGSVFDFCWNYLVLHVTLKIKSPSNIITRRKAVYSLIITALGLVIDWLYYSITWGRFFINLHVNPLFPVKGSHPVLEFVSILMPMAALSLINFALARFYLHLKPKTAMILGAVMGFFTAPWLIVLAVLVFQSGLVRL